MESLKDFAQRNGAQNKIDYKKQVPQRESLRDFAARTEHPIKNKISSLKDFALKETAPARKVVKDKALDLFRVVGKELAKPQGIMLKEMRGIGDAIGNLMSIASPRVDAKTGIKKAARDLIDAQKHSFNVLKGTEETSFYDEIKDSNTKAGREFTNFDKVYSIGADLLVDPLSEIKPIKALEKVGEVSKLGKPIKTAAKALSDSAIAEKLGGIFRTSTGNKEADKVISAFRNLAEYREGKLLDQAVQLQKDIKKIGGNAEELIVEGLENAKSIKNIADQRVVEKINTLKKVYGDYLSHAKKVGLKVNEVMEYAPRIRTKESFVNNLTAKLGLGSREFSDAGITKGRKSFENMTQKEIRDLGGKYTNFFEKNPAIQLVKKGQAYAKAITSKEFANAMEKFAVKDGVEVTNKMLKGLKFEPKVASVIDNFYKGIQPEELNAVIKGFDKVQNMWKAQALVSPSYHLRNMVGNLWNNHLASVNPWAYSKAALLQKGILKDEKLMNEMKKLGVIDQGWYAKDIAEELTSRVAGVKNWKAGLNPLSQSNYLFEANRKVGSAVENNARIAHYLSKRAEGLSPIKASESVKKYLFDYGKLSNTEKQVFKRAVPFYTWTRKNLPLQLSELVSNPGKFRLPNKIVDALERGVEQPDEKYMSRYISENVPVRIRTNKDGNTEYFLMGNWLPYASALDVLSQPLDTIVGMTSPFIKTPYEYFSNKSTYFKDTLGQPQEIERGGMEYGEFDGNLLRKKNMLLLRNIRLLNDLDKWMDKQDPTKVKDSWQAKLMNTLVGKTQTYDVGKSKYFYDRETEDKIKQYKKAIETARKKQYNEKADQIQQEMNEFIAERRGDN